MRVVIMLFGALRLADAVPVETISSPSMYAPALAEAENDLSRLQASAAEARSEVVLERTKCGDTDLTGKDFQAKLEACNSQKDDCRPYPHHPSTTTTTC